MYRLRLKNTLMLDRASRYTSRVNIVLAKPPTRRGADGTPKGSSANYCARRMSFQEQFLAIARLRGLEAAFQETKILAALALQ